ncbi:phosphate ABC transporter substrate-binding protein PstS [soil metagenome]
MRNRRFFSAILALAALSAGLAAADPAVKPRPASAARTDSLSIDAAIPNYAPVPGVTGNLKSAGSNTMSNMMTRWADAFKKFYPAVKVEIEGKGSNTALTGLIAGTAQLGPMSRDMKKSEVDEFEKKFGYKPIALPTAVDALAVLVHKDCPLTEISFDQIRAVFSVEGKDMTWGDLGIKDAAWAAQRVSLYGRDSASGTNLFFKEHALDKKDYKPTVKEQPGAGGVADAVGSDKFAMGYSGIGVKNANVKALKVRKEKGDAAVTADAEHAYSGEYPLARYLYIYINAKPGTKLDPLRAEFIRLIYSKQGQEAVIADGFYPIKADAAREALKSVGIEPKF